jgi:hypothetical protein
MSSETQLGQECRKLLIAADIYGHTYEYHGQHRDRVWKEPGESRLNRETANMPDNIIDVLKIAGAFLLEPEGEISTANGMIKLTKKSSPSEDSGFIDYTFLVAGYYSMTVTLRISEKSLASDAIEHSILEMCLEEWMPEEEEYNHSAVFKEIVDDIVADFDHIYTATEAPPVISFTEKPEPTEQEIADLEQMTCRRDFLGFHALINLDCELMNRISNANGNLEEVATIAKSLGYDATKGNWRRLQMLRMGTRTSKEMVEHWNVMLKRLSLAEIEDLTLH